MRNIDIRIKLLDSINSMKKGSEEFIANKFLSDLHSDLGTIKRLLIELLDTDLILESNIKKDDFNKSIIRNIDTEIHDTDPDKFNKKSSKRLVQKVGNFDIIPSIRLIITLKGINFLIENRKLRNELLLTNWQKYWYWPIAGIALAGLAISIIALCI